jgi:thioredoxin 1
MKHARIALLVAAFGAAAVACTQGGAAEPSAPRAALPSTHQGSSALPRLVFFMNPNGGPCQMQDRILREMGAELTARAEVVYYKTTEPGDIARFQEYGIRSLPMLLVTDGAGRELRRATPGIHTMPEIVQLLSN